MTTISPTFARAEITYRQERIRADVARAAGPASGRPRLRRWFGTVPAGFPMPARSSAS